MSRDPKAVPPVGSYGVTATGGVAGWFIRLGTFSRYNHAFIVGPGGIIVEATPYGAQYGHVSAYPKAKYNWADQITPETRERIWKEAEATLGTRYGWLDIFAFILKFFGLSTRAIDRRIMRQDRLICSQLVDLVYERAGINLYDDGRLPHHVSPGDLADLLAED